MFSKVPRARMAHMPSTSPKTKASERDTRPLERDDFSSNRHRTLSFCLSMIFSETRYPLFRIMLQVGDALPTLHAGLTKARLCGGKCRAACGDSPAGTRLGESWKPVTACPPCGKSTEV